MFDAPPEGAMPTAGERALSIKYAALKTAENWAGKVDEQMMVESIANCKLGFHYWDKDNKVNVSVPEFTFVVLQVYVGISGFDGDRSYWSNRVLDTRTDELIVFTTTGQIAKGFYGARTNNSPATVGGVPMPQGAGYTKFVKAYCIQLEKVVEIELTAASERGMQKAIAKAEQSVGRNAKWEKIFTLGLAQNDHLWGFHLQGYEKATKDGQEYKGKGDLFFEPVFHAGIVNPVNHKDLHATCVDAQNSERALHEAYKEKYKQETDASPQVGPNGARNADIPDREFSNNYAFPENNQPNAPMPDQEPPGDDLPF